MADGQQPMGEEVAVGRNPPIARLERAGTVSCKRVPPRQRGHYLVHLASEPER